MVKTKHKNINEDEVEEEEEVNCNGVNDHIEWLKLPKKYGANSQRWKIAIAQLIISKLDLHLHSTHYQRNQID